MRLPWYKNDNKMAYELDRKLAENGDPESQKNLCFNEYLYNKEDPRNIVILPYDAAYSWCVKSANQGDAGAQAQLCELSYKMKNYKESLNWCGASSEHRGHGISQYILGKIYQDGKGVPQNLVTAYMWYYSACFNYCDEKNIDKIRQDDPDVLEAAIMRLAQIEKALTSEQIETAKNQAIFYAQKMGRNTSNKV